MEEQLANLDYNIEDLDEEFIKMDEEIALTFSQVNLLLSVFWIRIRSDPYHWAGSGSTSGNVDLNPGTKKIVINSHTNQPKL